MGATPPSDELHTADLDLARACIDQDPAALAAFEARVISGLDQVLRRLKVDQALADEALQLVRTKLFVASDGEVPHISTYSGRGELRGWVRSIAVRTALKLRDRHRRDVSDDDGLIDRMSAGTDDPELAHLKSRYRREFEAAFRLALDGLDAPSRTLLRQHHFDGLTVDQLGAMYAVNRATAARRLVKVREELLEATHRALVDRFGIAPDQINSVMRLARSQVDISVRRLLTPPAPPAPPAPLKKKSSKNAT